MVIDKWALVISDNVKNSTCVINNNLTWRKVGTNESEDSAQITLSIDWMGYKYKQVGSPFEEDVFKERAQCLKFWSNQSHQLVTYICTYKKPIIFYSGGI